MPMMKKGTCDVICYDEGALLTEVLPYKPAIITTYQSSGPATNLIW